MAKTITRNS